MQLILLLCFCIIVNTSCTMKEYKSVKQMILNSEGQKSRGMWKLHENEADSLDRRMFDDDSTSNKKIHYTKRKYNRERDLKWKKKLIEHTSKIPATLSNTMGITGDIEITYFQNSERPKILTTANFTEIDRTMNSIKLGKKISIGKITERKKTKGSFLPKKISNHNVGIEKPSQAIEANEQDGKNKTKSMKMVSKSLVQMKPKTVYVNKLLMAGIPRKAPSTLILKMAGKVKNPQRENVRPWYRMSEEIM